MSAIFILSEEEQCALADIARFGRVDVVAPAFRDKLLIKLAEAATLTGSDINESLDLDYALAVQFIHLSPLTERSEKPLLGM